MLQNTEYEVLPYLAWFWRTRNFAQIEYRREVDQTRAARLLKRALQVMMVFAYVTIACLIYLDIERWQDVRIWPYLVAIALLVPLLSAHVIVLPLLLARYVVIAPRRKKYIAEAEKVFARHNGVRIAILGSYGKTSMKELLKTVLASKLKVAATPANKNVAISHAEFAHTLTGKEDVVLIEYGEGAPGDIARFAQMTRPSHAIITGLAPAHLDKYKTLEKAAKDIFSIGQFVDASRIFVAGDSAATEPYIDQKNQVYTRDGLLGWKVDKVHVSFDSLVFRLRDKKQQLIIRSQLLGRHQVAPLALAAVLGLLLGMKADEVENAIAAVSPYKHRMQPYELNGAWIIDDTYNGNLEGIRAGTQLLAELKAKRKIYVTPGLVDQGKDTEKIHIEVGALIAAAAPDIVVLMQNSVTEAIRTGLFASGYKGQIIVEPKPLEFYSNLPAFVAAGDIVLQQNDWTDNYH